jgi:subtilisin-like proprotein convertase family protein
MLHGYSRGMLSCLAAILIGTSAAVGASESGGLTLLELRTPELRPYWVESSHDMLSPALRTSSDTLKIRPSRSSVFSIETDHRLILHLLDTAILEDILRRFDLQLLHASHLQGVFIVASTSPMQAMITASRLAREPFVQACYPVEKKPFRLKNKYALRPNDPYFGYQWHLEQRDSISSQISGADLNIRAAWPVSLGQGVRLAVVDVGVDLDHPDLQHAMDADYNHNFINGSQDGRPVSKSFFHGTAVGGLITAENGNDVGISGVAPLASLSSWVIFGFGGSIADSLQLSEMYEFSNDQISIQNHSWGNAYAEQLGPSFMERLAISNAFHHGRSRKGTIMVRAGGNDRNGGDFHPGLGDVNDDGYTSMHTVMAVAATRRDGRATSYSNWGACLLVAAPGGERDDGLFTTDVVGVNGFNRDVNTLGGGDYISNERGFIGTSAAAPLISGLAALSLSVNPDLTARDIQQIMLNSARHVYTEDPDIRPNAAGFRHSHHVGFGIPDAGEVVRLSQSWSLRDDLRIASFTSALRQQIPDHGLRLKVMGETVPAELQDLPASTTMGLQPDSATGFLPVRHEGRALNPITRDLTGMGALIRRGSTTFDAKIRNAAQAGAVFVVIYNQQDDDQLIRMAGTDYAPLPAFFIAREQGEQLAELVDNDPTLRMQLSMNAAVYEFEVDETMICEHVELIVDSDHFNRGQLRIVLEAPSGTRSVLQRLNFDDSPGPIRWAYRSTRHFYEPSAGTWKVKITDQETGDTGAIRSLRLSILGTQIKDADRDGLDDDWERNQFGNLSALAHEDPDRDGSSNAREQALETRPLVSDITLELSLGFLDEEHMRLSWPSRPGRQYQIRSVVPGSGDFTALGTLESSSFETEWIVSLESTSAQFFQVLDVTQD